MGSTTKTEFESELDDLVAKFQNMGLDLNDISDVLHLKFTTVTEAINEPNDQ